MTAEHPNPTPERMTFEGKLQEIRADLRWLVNECLKDEADESANVACAAVLSVGAVIDKLTEEGLDESEWNR